MQHLPEVLKIVQGGLARDPVKVSRYADLLATKLEAEGDTASSDLLRSALQALKVNGLHAAEVSAKTALPVDTESRISLADVTHPNHAGSRLVVPEHVQQSLDDFILGYRRQEDLLSAGLTSPGHILLHGPPGCGKSQSASYVAAELALPLVTARLDGLVSSFLGATAKNIRALFDFVHQTPCVFFLDEFDAVAKMRDDPHELGELKRVVNSLLQNIDYLPPGTAVVAATNHPHLLDPAVWRRFEFHVHIGLPDRQDRARLFEMYLPKDSGDPIDVEILAAVSDGYSAADVRRACELMARELALTNPGRFQLKDAVRALFVFASRVRSDEPGRVWPAELNGQISALRQRDPRLFTYDVISRVLGVSKSKISHVLNGAA